MTAHTSNWTTNARARASAPPSDRTELAPRWSWRAGSIAGIRVYVHATFLVLLAWVGLSHLAQGHGLAGAVAGIVLVMAIFAIVVLHELGHALTARRFGIRTRDITLLPIGGVARLERMPERPREELLVALAGPAVNVVLAALLFGASALAHYETALATVHVVGGPFLTKLAWVNVSLAVFNLLPAFPMDGGRVLRAALAMRMDRVRATAIAASLGQAMALLFGLLGLWTNPMLVFIALFVWIGAQEEASSVQLSSSLEGLGVQDAMLREFRALDARDTVGHAVDILLGGFQADFPVLEREELVGVLTRDDVIRALATRGVSTPIAEAMHRRFEATDPREPLERALARLHQADCDVLPVVDGGRLVGMLRLENVGELVAVRAAMRVRLPDAEVPRRRSLRWQL